MSISAEELNRIMNHMNEDHGQSLVLYAHAFTNRGDVTEAKMVNLTATEILLQLESGEQLAVPLSKPVNSAKDAHTVLVEMHKQAAAQLSD